VVDGYAAMKDFKEGDKPEATYDMSAVFGEDLRDVTRKFSKENNRSITIEDHFETTPSTRHITWQMMTTADVEFVDGGAILKQDGKQLKLENLSHPDLAISVISLDPAPLELDRQIDNLKRIEIRLPAYLFKEGKGEIKVRLSGE